MAKVQRANRLLTVPDETVEKYLSDGYNLVGEDGGILRRGVTKNAADLLKELEAAKKRVAELEAKAAELEAKAPKKPPRKEL